jgi:hypothetical protein
VSEADELAHGLSLAVLRALRRADERRHHHLPQVGGGRARGLALLRPAVHTPRHFSTKSFRPAGTSGHGPGCGECRGLGLLGRCPPAHATPPGPLAARPAGHQPSDPARSYYNTPANKPSLRSPSRRQALRLDIPLPVLPRKVHHRRRPALLTGPWPTHRSSPFSRRAPSYHRGPLCVCTHWPRAWSGRVRRTPGTGRGGGEGPERERDPSQASSLGHRDTRCR